MRYFATALAAGMLAGLAAASAGAKEPDFSDYYITPNHGPWMIYVVTFRGDEAYTLARDMVSELRRDFKLPAFMYSHSDTLRAVQREQIQEIKKRRREQGLDEDAPIRRERIIDEYVVLVGNYKDMDAAAKALDKQREKFKDSDKVPMKDYFSKLFMGVEKRDPNQDRQISIQADKSTVQTYRENPLVRGMVVPNPHPEAVKAREAEREKERAKNKFDPAWKELNKHEEYSIFKCPKKYTLVVKVFPGASVIKGFATPSVMHGDENKQLVQQLERATRFGNKNLSAQGFEAHNLAKLMRDKQFNYEAYVFHHTEYSLVTVGSFDDPAEAAKLKNVLKGVRFGVIQLSDDPVVMEIPRP